MDLEKKFASTIYRMRISADEKLTQQDVADFAGITLRYYSDLEKGKRNPTLRIICGIAEAYGISASELLQRVENN